MIRPQALREAVRTISINYAGVPWVIGLLFAFAFACLGLLAVTPARVEAVIEGLAIAAAATGLAASMFCVFFRPDRLRSERLMVQNRLIDLIENSDTNPEAATYARDLLDASRPKQPDDKLGKLTSARRVSGDADAKEMD